MRIEFVIFSLYFCHEFLAGQYVTRRSSILDYVSVFMAKQAQVSPHDPLMSEAQSIQPKLSTTTLFISPLFLPDIDTQVGKGCYSWDWLE